MTILCALCLCLSLLLSEKIWLPPTWFPSLSCVCDNILMCLCVNSIYALISYMAALFALLYVSSINNVSHAHIYIIMSSRMSCMYVLKMSLEK